VDNTILIRYNSNREQGSLLFWRIFVNNIEHLASSFEATGTMFSAVSEEDGAIKHNVGCVGFIDWDGTHAIIKTV